MRWDLPRSIHVPNLKFLSSPVPKTRQVPLNGWVLEGVCTNSRIVVFLSDPTKFGANIAEWSMLNANVLDFHYQTTPLYCLRIGTKNGANFEVKMKLAETQHIGT